MKISKYTFLFDVDSAEFYIYSTLSNALIEIDEVSYELLREAKMRKSDVSGSDLDDELYKVLESKKFIVENDMDGFLYYKSIIMTQRADTTHLHMTIAPTMDCCFRCHYCFEKYKEPNYMSVEVMDSIVNYLKKQNGSPDYRLTWFGGEPLMALEQIERLYDKLESGYKKPTSSNMITTGFHINKEAVRVMKKVGVEQVQITLDGLKDTHNKVKFTHGCDDAFTTVLDNIELLLSSSDIHVIFRVNLTKQNASEYVELYNCLINRYEGYRNFGVSPAFVMDRGACTMTDNGDGALFFSPSDTAKFVIDLNHRYKIHSPFLLYPSRFFNECAIRNVMSISFDPEGYAYKCWEVIGNKEYAVGRLNPDGLLRVTNEVTLNRHLFGADPFDDAICSSCRYLPICHGGCPIQRIENTFEGKKNCCCTYRKGYLEKFLKIHLALVKAGFDNH